VAAVFYDREEELTSLERRYGGPQGEFLVIWGRRRVGKTELLARFLRGKRGFLFEGTESLERDHLADLSRLLAAETGIPLLAAQPLQSWEAALAALESYAAEGPCAAIFDEFQWIARASPGIGSLINRWWRRARSLPLLFVVCGSEVSFFEKHVLRGAMFGRRTGQLKIAPFDCRKAALFLDGWSAEERVRAYAVFGGMPYYLEQIDPSQSLAANILSVILRRDGVLREEARLLLHEELPDPPRYFSILRAIAAGATRRGEIVNRTGLSPAVVDQALQRLVDLYLVERSVPVTTPNPERTKQVRYRLLDGYLAFYFRFVHPYEGRLLSDSDARAHLHGVVLPQLDLFVSAPAFERVAHEYVRRCEPEAVAVGRWWGQVVEARRSSVREIDIVAVSPGGKVTALGSCRWSGRPMGRTEHDALVALLPHIPGTSSDARLYFVSRSGFSAELASLAAAQPERYRLVTPSDLLSDRHSPC
jgi:hypothetical protein